MSPAVDNSYRGHDRRTSLDKSLPPNPPSGTSRIGTKGYGSPQQTSPRDGGFAQNQTMSPEDRGIEYATASSGAGSTRRRPLRVEGSAEPISLEGIVDLTNTEDSETIRKVNAPVVNEIIVPQVHHVTQEVIHREIHTHDVIHRILPVIDVEILPTKHFIPDPARPGSLIEIPASAVPSRTNNWQISVNNPVTTRHSHGATAVIPESHLAHARAEPILSSKREYVTKSGIPKTEFVWRHPPQLEEPTADSVPLPMNCVDKNHPGSVAANRYNSADEEALYDNQGYGSGGMLPGLDSQVPRINKQERNTSDSYNKAEYERRTRDAEDAVSAKMAKMNMNETRR